LLYFAFTIMSTQSTTPSGVVSSSTPAALSSGYSIPKRVFLFLVTFIFGMIFCYVLMVIVFVFASNVTLDPLEYNGWSRVASRATGALSVPFFILFLILPPSSIWTLISITLTFCNHLIHLAILWSDVRIFDASNSHFILKSIFYTSKNNYHPLYTNSFYHLRWWTLYVFGSFGYACLVLLVIERVFGGDLGRKSHRYGFVSKSCSFIVWLIFCLFFIDRLIASSSTMNSNSSGQIWYPITFLTLLFISAFICIHKDRQNVPSSNESSKIH